MYLQTAVYQHISTKTVKKSGGVDSAGDKKIEDLTLLTFQNHKNIKMHRFLAVIITCVGLFLRCQSKTATTVAVKSNSICHGNAIQMARNSPFLAKNT